MNKSQELQERMNSLKSFQDDSGTIDFDRDRPVIEELYGPIVDMTDEEFSFFLRKEAEKRGQTW